MKHLFLFLSLLFPAVAQGQLIDPGAGVKDQVAVTHILKAATTARGCAYADSTGVRTELMPNDCGTARVVESLINTPKYASNYNWQQQPAAPATLSIGANTIALSPCPAGMFVNPAPWAYGTWYTPTHYVYIAGAGTPEAALATRVSGYSGDASCQVSVSLVRAHGAGYTVGSASGGIKEASEAAKSIQGWGFGGGLVIIDGEGSPYNIYAPLHFEASWQKVQQAGGRLECYVSAASGWRDDDCIVVGQRGSSTATTNVTLDNLVIHPANGNTANFGFDAIHVNAQSTAIHNPVITIGTANHVDPRHIPTGSFTSDISVCDDQAFTLDGMYVNNAGSVNGLRSDRKGQLIAAMAPGDHTHGNVGTCNAVGWLSHINGSLQCAGNVVNWSSGNGLSISDSVVQGFSQYGLRTGTPGGGYNGNTVLENVYFEVGGCTNPDYVTAGANGHAAQGMAGVISYSGTVWMRGSTGIGGAFPVFACSGNEGSNFFNYWVMPHAARAPSGTFYSRAWLYAGQTTANCSGSVDVYFPATVSSAISPPPFQYDVLRTIGAGSNLVQPYYGGTPGGSVTATGSVAINLNPSGGTIEKFTDNVGNPTRPYNPQSYFYDRRLVPNFANNFWPGGVVLENSARLQADPNESNVTYSNVITTDGPYNPVAWSMKDVQVLGGISTSIGDANTATLLMNAGYGTPFPGLPKGRLNFFLHENTGVFPGSVITLVDSSPSKTAAAYGYRPAMDPTDVWIGTDTSGNRETIGYAQGSPVSISEYINSLPDGSSWKERLTIDLKQFNVPISAKGGSANRVTCWKADGRTIGYCSSVPAPDGSCRCN